jgi:outer membrane lipoprotein-sorting protein
VKNILVLFLLTFWGIKSTITLALSPEEILKKADDIRNPTESFQMMVSVKSSGDQDLHEFEVFTKGKDLTLIKTLNPKKNIGRNLLMLEENMWAYVPNLKRSVRVGLSQKLTGQTANGDISRMRWAGDYDVTLENTQSGKDEKKVWQLLLKAKAGKTGLTYNQIRLWVKSENFYPLQAEYLSTTGKPLKLAQFKEFKNLAKAIRPSVIEIRDATQKSKDQDLSVITILSMKLQKLDDQFFDQANLGP